MGASVRVFLGTSALFAGLWSATGGARMILKLGEAGVIRLLVAPQVLIEAEQVLRRKAPDLLGPFALLLDRGGVETVPAASQDSVQVYLAITSYRADAVVIAAANDALVNYFVTLDREHFPGNDALKGAVPFPIGTPGDFLTWYREQL